MNQLDNDKFMKDKFSEYDDWWQILRFWHNVKYFLCMFFDLKERDIQMGRKACALSQQSQNTHTFLKILSIMDVNPLDHTKFGFSPINS